MNIFQFIYLYFTDKREYIHQKREHAKELLRLRYMEMDRRVFVQDILHYHRDNENHWQRKSYISIEGVIICEYTEETYQLFDRIYHNYYIRHRHSLLHERR